MAVNIQRRNAFAAAFNQYPTILERFARDNCTLKSPFEGGEVAKKESDEKAIMQILLAQFCVRLLNTRANGATSAIEDFVTGCMERYHEFHKKHLGALIIEAPPQYRAAIVEIESNMAALIMHSLAAEAEVIDAATSVYAAAMKHYRDEDMPPPDDLKPPEDIDEGSFWHDIFLALCQNQQKHHPLWTTPVNFVVLDHVNEMKAAFNVQ